MQKKKQKFNALDTMLSSCGNSFYEDGSQNEFYLMTRENKVAKKLDYSDMDTTSNHYPNISKANNIYLQIADYEKTNQIVHPDDGKFITFFLFK